MMVVARLLFVILLSIIFGTLIAISFSQEKSWEEQWHEQQFKNLDDLTHEEIVKHVHDHEQRVRLLERQVKKLEQRVTEATK